MYSDDSTSVIISGYVSCAVAPLYKGAMKNIPNGLTFEVLHVSIDFQGLIGQASARYT